RGRRAAGALLLCVYSIGTGVIAAHREAEAVLEVEPAHFAVGDDVEADRLLQRDMALDAFELHTGKLGGAELARLERQARLFPFRRPQQAAHHVGADAIKASHFSSPLLSRPSHSAPGRPSVSARSARCRFPSATCPE